MYIHKYIYTQIDDNMGMFVRLRYPIPIPIYPNEITMTKSPPATLLASPDRSCARQWTRPDRRWWHGGAGAGADGSSTLQL